MDADESLPCATHRPASGAELLGAPIPCPPPEHFLGLWRRMRSTQGADDALISLPLDRTRTRTRAGRPGRARDGFQGTQDYGAEGQRAKGPKPVLFSWLGRPSWVKIVTWLLAMPTVVRRPAAEDRRWTSQNRKRSPSLITKHDSTKTGSEKRPPWKFLGKVPSEHRCQILCCGSLQVWNW